MTEGWVVPENRALARRPSIMGLELRYAALLLTTCMFLAMYMHRWGAAAVVFGCGYGLGRLVAWYDPHAFQFLLAGMSIPRVLRP